MGKFLAVAVVLCVGCATGGTQGPTPDSRAAADFETGRRVYVLHCVRCHGRDGKDDTYPFIATLDGIGKRMTPEEILKATWATGFASPDDFTEEERRGLGSYVATL